MRLIFLSFACLLTWLSCDAVENKDTLTIKKQKQIRRVLRPDYLALQYAGNIGFLSGGIGYMNRSDRYQLSIVYGYVPARYASVSGHLVTAKNVFHFAQSNISDRYHVIAYGSIGISVEVAGRSFFFQPDNMPPGYYDFPKSIHAIPGLGLKCRRQSKKLKGFEGVEFFAEVSTVDVYVWYKWISRHVEFHDILSMSCGVNLIRRR
jgi:hypothetical protein